MPLMPVLAARTRYRPSSIARIEACAKCWYGADVAPNHASFVIVVSSSLPADDEAPHEIRIDDLVADRRADQVPADRQQRPPARRPKSPTTASTSGAAKNSTRLSGTYSPNGTRCIFRYTPAVVPSGRTRNAEL